MLWNVGYHKLRGQAPWSGRLPWFLLFCCLLCLGLPIAASGQIPSSFSDKEMVRNGDFSSFTAGWQLIGDYSIVKNDIGPDGGPALEMENFSDRINPRAYASQILHPPTSFTAGSFSFDYRLVQQSGGYAGGLTLDLVKGNELSSWVSLGRIHESPLCH